jgi:signal peptidase I
MNGKSYPKWVGVVLGLLLNGSAHYLAGKRTTGVSWFLSIRLSAIAAMLILAVSGILSIITAGILFLTSITLWLIMLKQSFRAVERIGIRGWLIVLVLVIALNSAFRIALHQVVQPFKVPTGAMIPTLTPGDHVVAERASYWFSPPKRGDIVIFNTTGLEHPAVRPNVYYIKRIAGLPGETVQISPPNLIVDGRVIKEPAIFADISTRSNGFTLASRANNKASPLSSPDDQIVLGKDQYLTLGDNTESSLDGRYYGPISREQIYGRVSRIYWPLSRAIQ